MQSRAATAGSVARNPPSSQRSSGYQSVQNSSLVMGLSLRRKPSSASGPQTKHSAKSTLDGLGSSTYWSKRACGAEEEQRCFAAQRAFPQPSTVLLLLMRSSPKGSDLLYGIRRRRPWNRSHALSGSRDWLSKVWGCAVEYVVEPIHSLRRWLLSTQKDP